MRGTFVERTWRSNPALYAPARYRKACSYDAFIPEPMTGFDPSLSGAIAGVLGAFILLCPKDRIEVLMGYGVVPVPALIVIGLWFVLQLVNEVGSIVQTSAGSGVAYMAHVGGFIAGIIFAFIFGRGQEQTLPKGNG